MNLALDRELGAGYKSAAQKIRVVSEAWLLANAWCAGCGSALAKFPNNNPFADAWCPACGEEYELKSSRTALGGRLADGAYSTMIGKINAGLAPNLFHLHYDPANFHVLHFTLVPRQFIIADLVIKRAPLTQGARRKGWTGCFIDTDRIPEAGKIRVIAPGYCPRQEEILDMYQRVRFLQASSPGLRGWKLDIIRCIEKLSMPEFTLKDMRQFVAELKKLHPANRNIEAKIRQQLQFLRDAGYLEFLGSGKYRLKSLNTKTQAAQCAFPPD